MTHISLAYIPPCPPPRHQSGSQSPWKTHMASLCGPFPLGEGRRGWGALSRERRPSEAEVQPCQQLVVSEASAGLRGTPTQHTNPRTLGVWTGWTAPLEDEEPSGIVLTLPGPRWDQPPPLLRTTRQDVTFERPAPYKDHKTKGTVVTSGDA